MSTKRPLTEQEQAILEEAKFIYPVNEETGVFWLNMGADAKEVTIPIGEHEQDIVKMDGRIGDQSAQFRVGYSPTGNVLVVLRRSGHWSKNKGGYQKWIGDKDAMRTGKL